jgi:nucleotide-binding universal stress UspA family protein
MLLHNLVRIACAIGFSLFGFAAILVIPIAASLFGERHTRQRKAGESSGSLFRGRRSRPMCKRILVLLDGSRLSERALAPAALLAKRCAADLLLLVGATRGYSFPGLLTSAVELQAHDMERYLTRVATPLRAEGITVETAVQRESPARAIAAHSDGRGVDLIVTATRGRTGLEALLHPSVTWAVLGQSPVPVLALKYHTDAEGHPPEPTVPRFLTDPAAPILVPLDGSRRAERALPLAEQFARFATHPLVLVRATGLPYLAGGVIDYPMTLAHLEEWSLEEARIYLERKQSELARTGLEVKTAAMLGEAVASTLDCVQKYQAGMVVIASHGRSGLNHLFLGSVARRLLSCVAVPLLLVPAALG